MERVADRLRADIGPASVSGTMAGGVGRAPCSVSPIRKGFPKTLAGTEAVMCSIAAVRTIPEGMNRTNP